MRPEGSLPCLEEPATDPFMNQGHADFYGGMLLPLRPTPKISSSLNLSSETGYPDWGFRGFPQFLQVNFGMVH
jgi:hypothetical protein